MCEILQSYLVFYRSFDGNRRLHLWIIYSLRLNAIAFCHQLEHPASFPDSCSGGSRISQKEGGGTNSSVWGVNLLFGKILPKTAWKWKKFDPEGGRVASAPPLDPNDLCWLRRQICKNFAGHWVRIQLWMQPVEESLADYSLLERWEIAAELIMIRKEILWGIGLVFFLAHNCADQVILAPFSNVIWRSRSELPFYPLRVHSHLRCIRRELLHELFNLLFTITWTNKFTQ